MIANRGRFFTIASVLGVIFAVLLVSFVPLEPTKADSLPATPLSSTTEWPPVSSVVVEEEPEPVPLPVQVILPTNEAGEDSTGLLPWDTPVIAPVEEQVADGPEDLTASSNDEAVILYETIQKENALVEEAVLKLPAAKRKAAEAQEASRIATMQALNLRAESQEADANKDGAIRGIYMSGGAPSIAEILFAETNASAFDMLVTHEQANTATQNTISTALALRKASADADAAALTAMQAAEEANLAVTDLEETIKVHSAAAAAAAAAYTEYLAKTGPQLEIAADGCPISVPEGTLRGGSAEIGVTALCQRSVALAATPQAALAIKWAFSKLGAPYACKGVGRMAAWRFDCSSLTSRAYAEGAGFPFVNNGNSHTTRNMMPWDGYSLDPHYEEVPVEMIAPGDLLLTRSCSEEPCAYQHVTMALSDGFILQTNSCGDVAHVTLNPGYGADARFVVARRVVLLEGEQIPASILASQSGYTAASSTHTANAPESVENSFNRPNPAAQDTAGERNPASLETVPAVPTVP